MHRIFTPTGAGPGCFRRVLLTLSCFAGLGAAQAQPGRPAAGQLWHDSPAARQAAATANWARQLTAFRAVAPDAAALAATLAAAPLEGQGSGIVLALPTPDGGTARFRVVESPMMEAPLQARFPQIRTYAGVGIDDPAARLRADLTPRGFHAQVLTGDPARDFKLDPVDDNQPARGLLSYWRADERLPAPGPAAVCRELAGPGRTLPPLTSPSTTGQRVQASVGASLRTYRWAVAATGEFTASQGGTVTSALASITTTANRVSGIYEYEVAVRLVLIANNDQLIYTSGTTDPYTSGNKSLMIDENRTNLDAVIGTSAYDVGHVFDATNIGGLAYLGAVCNGGLKGGASSGLTTPSGSAFEGVVAHETGHQFSARHTFSGTTGSCTPSNPTSGWEPGSGSTIMAYGGLCGADNVAGYQQFAYFHGGSIEQMANYVAAGGTCATSAGTGNNVPIVTSPTNRSIPAATPFKLTAAATDPDGDALTFSWEQMDVGSGTLITSSTTQTAGSTMPLFRSWPAVTTGTRYFPRLSDLRNNTTVAGETLPTVDRQLNFRCTVRDQHFSPGLNRTIGGISQSNTVALTVVNTGAAFAVTAPNTAVSLTGGQATTVTWNVAGTTANGINCASVNLLLSIDGGQTFPITLLANTSNDGSESVALPNLATTQARIMVEAADNYFFDVSNVNFTITTSSAPIVTTFTPTSGPAGTVVTITGTNFTGATAVRFNGVDAASFTVNASNNITATVPAGTATGPISVVAASGFGLSTASFTLTGQPTVTAFTPASGQPGTVVTITGTNFTGTTAVRFNGTAATSFTVNSATQLTATVPAGAATGPITVVNASGTGSSGAFFTVPTVPTITSFTPGVGGTGTSVTLTGTDFLGATAVRFNGTTATFAVLNNTTISTSVPAGATSGPVSVTTPLGTGTSTAIFTTLVPPTNDICSPNNPVLTCGASVTGTTLGATTTGDPTATCTTSVDGGGVFYRFAGTGGSVTVTTCSATTNYDSKLFVFSGSCGNYTCVGGNDDLACASNSSGTTSSVTFNSVAGTTYLIFVAGYSTEAGTFTLTATCAPPTLTSFSPVSGPVGTSVTLTGTLLATTSAVRFNGTAATSFTVNSATSVTATVPAGATSGPVAVTTAAGIATSANAFSVLLPPSLTAQTFNLAENAANGTAVGTVVATDPNAGETLTYSLLSGNTGGAFALNAATGQITVANAAALDFETNPAFALTVRVADNGSPSQNATATITVNLSNLAEVPTVTAFTPTSGPAGTVVTVTGTNFQSAGAPTVRFNGTLATGVTVGSATSLTATVPAGATTGALSVTNADGTGTSVANFTVPAVGSAPKVTTFTPASGVTGTSVTITGQNFTGATAVAFGGVAATSFTVNSATSITATVPAAALTGTVSVTTGGGPAASTATFKVVPTLTAFSPAQGMPGALVTLTGTGFSGVTSVRFGTLSTTTFTIVSPTTITVAVPATAITGKLAVVAAGGTAYSTASFTVGPVVTTFLPTRGAPGSVVLVQGLNFTSVTTVAFNGTNATRTYNSGTQLTAVVPTGATTGPISVGSTVGTSTSAGTFTVVSGAYPTISSFSPTANVIAGTSITITGTNFIGATLVRFNNVNATSFTVNSATSITATVPAGALSGKLYVANPSGMGQSVGSLIIVQPPTITTLSPITGAVGSVVLLGGSNLTGATSVTLNGAAVPYTVNSAAQIVATIPAAATTGKFAVTTIAGTAQSVATFTVSAGPAPTITSLSATSGVRGASVVITGSNFTGVTSVKLGAIAVMASAYTVNTSTQITFTVPSTAITGRVYVTTSGGGMAQSATYTVILVPTISSFTPASGAAGTTVTVNGTNYAGITSVKFGGVTASSFTIVSTAKLTAVVPAGAATGTITVTNAAGTATSAGIFTFTGVRPAAIVTTPEAVSLELWPNPASETVYLTGPVGAEARFYDGLGRLLRTVTLAEGVTPLDVRSLPAGVYTVRVGTATRRLEIGE